MTNEWIRASHALPDACVPVLIWAPGFEAPTEYWREGDRWCESSGYHLEIDHPRDWWRPMPEPPIVLE